MTTAPEAAKDAAIRQWTSDPCGSGHVDGEPSDADYFRELLEMRFDYAPWMEEELDYRGAAGLDVLDVGSGQGIDLVRFAMEGARARGIDLTPRHVELANAHLSALGLAATAQVGDGESLPFDSASFDRVSSNGVLHHTPDMPAALREIARVLRPGGRATIIVYNRDSLHYWVHQFLTRGVLTGGLLRERGMAGVLSSVVEYSRVGARPLVRVYSRRQMRAAMTAAGFSGVEVHARHFNAADILPTRYMARVMPPLRDPAVLDRIGRAAGWYLVAVATR